MNRQLSQYLDLLRITAALLVLIAHSSNPAMTDGALRVPDEIGYSAVMIFFVLSGYVITYVASEREFTFREFSISRIARVYSVVLPAIAITAIIDLLLLHVQPFWHSVELTGPIPQYQVAALPKYILMDMLFANQLWGMREDLFSNAVYWSMCFEVYYYCLFAAAFYFRGIHRLALILFVLVAVGPGPWLRFPLWAFGCGVYWLHRRCQLPLWLARCLFVLSAALIAVDLATDLNLRIDAFIDSLTKGAASAGPFRRLIGDTLTGFLVAVNVFSARDAALRFGRIGPWFTYLASFSFTLYLVHLPLLRLWAGYLHPRPVGLLVIVLASAWLISQFTERQKTIFRDFLRRLSACAADLGILRP